MPLGPSTGPGWSLITSANTSATQNNTLTGVTCTSASDCWAVGYYLNGNVYQTLIERWDGTSWGIVTSPDNGTTQNNVLNGVTCVSASDCWAVGFYVNGGGKDQTLIEHWDGTSWSIVTSSTLTTENYALNGVTCASASDCWAVGFYHNANGVADDLTLIDHWDGTSWIGVPSQDGTTGPHDINILYGVTCTSATNCWAVGYNHHIATGAVQTLIEYWNGNQWTIVTSSGAILSDVTCTSASNCWAAGGNGIGTLTEHWNGTSWAIVTSPNSGAGNNILQGVTCTSASDCWAVGYYLNGSAVNQTLTELWNGSSWSIVSSPDNGTTQNNVLNGVTCASASECWAVGSYNNGSVNQTLIEEYSLTIPPLNGVVSRMTHGSITPPFDIPLPLTGTRGVECRSGGANGNYIMVFQFTNSLTSVGGASVTSGTGSVSNSAIGLNNHEYVVNLTGVADAQYITVSLTNVQDSAGNSGNVVGPQMGVLVGDTTANGVVNSSDIVQTQSQSGQPVTSSNFREDVTVNGAINSSDIALVQSQSGIGLPTSP